MKKNFFLCTVFSLFGFSIFAQSDLDKLHQAEQQIVLLQNSSQIPLMELDALQAHLLSFGALINGDFYSTLAKYVSIDTLATIDKIQPQRSPNDVYILGIYKENLSEEELSILKTQQQNLIVCAFANPSQWIRMIGKGTTLIVAPDSTKASQSVVAQEIFGGIAAQGKLSAKLGKYKRGFGLTTEATRLQYSYPEDAGIDGYKLETSIDSIVNEALEQQQFPGCVVLVAKDRKVVFSKAYGYHTYLKAEGEPYQKDVLNRKMEVNDLFDLASVTKVTAGCPAYLKLVDEGKINLEEKFSTYFPYFKATDKENITVKELLCHVGGMQAYSPFFKGVVNADGSLNPDFIRSAYSEEFPIRISPTLYARKDMNDYIYKAIAKAPLLSSYPQHKYVYSDWPFVMTPYVVESITHQPFEDFLQTTFYRSLGAYEMMYNPWRKIPLARIVPTETDNYFRQTQLQGYVHDETSGILGGHSANAGLFANVNDMAKLLQLYLQKGTYGGKRYFSEKTFDLFNSCPFESEGVRRGICFDKPDMENGRVVGHSYCSSLASPESFGHSGYTGTVFWVDPTCNLIYIFLSNRVYPTRNNYKLVTLKTRAKIQTAIYESLMKGSPRKTDK